MNGRSSFGNFPWLHNVRNAVDNVIHEFVHAAEDLTVNFEPPAAQAAQYDTTFPSRGGSSPPVNQRAPPASDRAIRQLPTIRVAPEDLIEPSNRECCICLEENSLDGKVTRLPCAHIFHSQCVIDWLKHHHCTCPVCRYELPTDDPQYEAGRTTRMKTRKPRFAMHELRRMSAPDLLALNPRLPPGVVEKAELIQTLIDQERIHIIPAPEPVEYQIQQLEAMRVSELKCAMEGAGVFFHSKDVVEKSDMLTIFKNSGRLNLILSAPDEGRDTSSYSPEHSDPVATDSNMFMDFDVQLPIVETVDPGSDEEENQCVVDESLWPPQEMFGPQSQGREVAGHAMPENNAPVPPPRHFSFFEDSGEFSYQERSSKFTSNGVATMKTMATDSGSVFTERNVVSLPCSSHADSSPLRADTATPTTVENSASIRADLNHADRGVRRNHDTTSAIYNHQNSTQEASEKVLQTADVGDALDDPDHAMQTFNETSKESNSQALCPFHEYSISQLQTTADEANVDLSGCFERSEMVELLTEAGVTASQPSNITRATFINCSVSQLRALSSEVNIDLSHCADREEMIDWILREANTQRPHLRNYLRALSPLAGSSLSQLRATAREWGVSISDCLEKEEIIQRLISRGPVSGICYYRE